MSERRNTVFLRFALSTRHRVSGVEDGIFKTAYALSAAPIVSPEHRQSLSDLLAWFEKNLPTPPRFNRSTSKGYDRRHTRGISWLRDNAGECIVRMHQLRHILEFYGYPVELIREERVGYVVYEDEFQVVAEPFADTRTRR